MFTVFLLFSALGCGVSHFPDCDRTTNEVADDEALPGSDITVADLFAEAAGARTVPAQVLDGERNVVDHQPLTVTVARGEGSATWTDAVEVDITGPYAGFGDVYADIAVQCFSGVSAPATLDVALADEAGALIAEADLDARDLSGDGTLGDETVEVSGSTTSATGDLSAIDGTYAGFDAGDLTRVQLQGDNDIRYDWM